MEWNAVCCSYTNNVGILVFCHSTAANGLVTGFVPVKYSATADDVSVALGMTVFMQNISARGWYLWIVGVSVIRHVSLLMCAKPSSLPPVTCNILFF